MATTIYLTDTASSLGFTESRDARVSIRGAGLNTGIANTTTFATSLTKTAGGTIITWYTLPLNAVTISGTLTLNVWMSENNMSANVDAEIQIQRRDGAANFISTIFQTAKGVELPVTTRAAQNWTGTPTSTTLSAGDRISFTIIGASTLGQASGFTFDGSWGATSGGVDGDTFVTFTETITEQTAAANPPYVNPMPPLIAQ
jgi:hypothetical protein